MKIQDPTPQDQPTGPFTGKIFNEETPRLLSIKQFIKKHEFISESSLRWLIYKGTIEHCLVRLSRRIYIHEQAIFSFLLNNNR